MSTLILFNLQLTSHLGRKIEIKEKSKQQIYSNKQYLLLVIHLKIKDQNKILKRKLVENGQLTKANHFFTSIDYNRKASIEKQKGSKFQSSIKLNCGSDDIGKGHRSEVKWYQKVLLDLMATRVFQ